MRIPKRDNECPADMLPTRSSLLGKLKDWEDHESWGRFFDTYWRLIYNFAVHRGLTHDEAQEVVQETVLAVAKSIGKFQYSREVCAFKTWLLTVTRSKIANQITRRVRNAAVQIHSPELADAIQEANSAAAENTSPWEQAWEEEWRQNLLETALRRVKKRVSIEQFQMFDLFVNKQLPASRVAEVLKVTVGHVYVAKHRIGSLIRKEIQALEQEQAFGPSGENRS